MSIRVTGNFASTLVASPSVVAVTQNFANFMGVSNSYRPVPGYTVCEREENGDLYLAVQMTKEKA